MVDTSTALIVGFYCLCSGGMLVINKVAISYINVPAFVTIVQFSTTAAVHSTTVLQSLPTCSP